MYALIDGNNFYVNCELLFNPRLRGKPVVVLSNNDGCVISRSDEAKAIGIKMAQPWFECKHFVKKHGAIAFSANFPLYGDISDRLMTLAAELGSEQEIYSIDECFINLTGHHNATERSKTLRTKILQWIGLPTCIGIAPTKTLAKLANNIAKNSERNPGSYPIEYAQVCNLSTLNQPTLDNLLRATPVGDIWGVGRRTSAPLIEAGITTAYDLSKLDLATARKRFSVTLERTICELKGMPCIEMDMSTERKQVTCTRSFGVPVASLESLTEAVTSFASKAAERLRKQGSIAGQVHVFIKTSPFRSGHFKSESITLPLRPTADIVEIVDTALKGLKQIYSQGSWIKAGVILLDPQNKAVTQGTLCFEEVSSSPKLMSVIDELNNRFGHGAIAVASSGITKTNHDWGMKQEHKSPHYTTQWEDIPTIKI